LGLIAPISLEHLFSSAGFFMKLIKGMHQAAQGNGYVVSLYIAETDDEASINIKTLVRSRAIDGLVITNPTFSPVYLKELKRYHIPFVFIGRPVEEVPFVDNDNVEVGRIATQHLIEHGHKKIAFLCGPQRFTFCQDRLSGYKKALELARIPYTETLVWRSEILEEAAYRLIRDQGLKEEFTALIAVTDVQAVGAIRALKELGYRVPEDISVIGINESSLAKHFIPSLTTIDLHEERLGYQAVCRLMEMIENDQDVKEPIFVEADLVIRDSCGCGLERR